MSELTRSREINPASGSSTCDSSPVLSELLARARRLCDDSHEGLSHSTRLISELQQRLAEERFHFAVLGQFKRGKSTLLNALLGEPLLPTGIVPLTSIPTFLRAGKTRVVRVFFQDGQQKFFSDLTREEASDILSRYVAETKNPKNQLIVDRVEVEEPSSLLSTGVVMIDTPGIGSTLRHNTETTFRLLPECDAALFVVSPDPPLTEIEKDFLNTVKHKVAKLCFVMNKIDQLTEQELAETSAFLRKTLGESDVDNPTIFNVSAKHGLESMLKHDPVRWRESGLEQLQSHLLDFLSREKSRALQSAIARKAADIVLDASMNVALRQRSFEVSQHELARRIEDFERKVTEIDQETRILGDLLAGDQKRTRQLLEDLAETLKGAAREHLRTVADGALQLDADLAGAERQAKERITEEVPAYFTGKLEFFSAEMNHALQQALRPHHQRLDELIRELRSTAAELFDIPYRPTVTGSNLEAAHRPYWVTQKWNTSVSPVPEGFLDRFLPGELRKHRLQKRLYEEVETVVTHNIENLRWATLRNLDDAFRRFSSNIDERLKEAAEATRGAMRAAHLRKTQDEESTEAEIGHFKQQAAELAALEKTLLQYADALRREGPDG